MVLTPRSDKKVDALAAEPPPRKLGVTSMFMSSSIFDGVNARLAVWVGYLPRRCGM
jgi:hypothetical protein